VESADSGKHIMKSQRSAILILCVAAMLVLAGAYAGAQENSRIVFLHLKMRQGKVVLLDQTTRAGSLKQSRAAQQYATWTYDLVSPTGEVLWSGTMRDPSFKRYEYEDPNEPGKIRSKQVLLDDVEFTVRVPHIDSAQRVQFYRSIATSAVAERPVRQSIGTIILGAAETQR
jgi:hypothetical protein